MVEFKDLNNKRVCDQSEDKRVIEIVRKDCVTIITANPDGTLSIICKRNPKVG